MDIWTTRNTNKTYKKLILKNSKPVNSRQISIGNNSWWLIVYSHFEPGWAPVARRFQQIQIQILIHITQVPVHKWYCSLLFHLCNSSIHVPDQIEIEFNCCSNSIAQFSKVFIRRNEAKTRPGDNISPVEQTDCHIFSSPKFKIFNEW